MSDIDISSVINKCRESYGLLADRLDKTINFSQQKQIDYLLELSTWLSDGVKPIDALQGISQIYALAGKENSIQSKATNSIMRAVDNGKPLYVGMEGYFSAYLVTIFKSAEKTGTMDKALTLLAEDDVQIKELKTTFLKPVIPTFLYLVLMIFSAINLVINVFPPLSKGNPIEDWPVEAQNFNALVNGFISYWYVGIIGIVIFYFWIKNFLENNTSELRRELDDLPVFNAYRTFISNQYLKMLSILMLSNIKPVEALKILEANGTPYVAWHAKAAQKKIDQGEKEIGKAIDTGIIADSVIIKMQYLTRVSTNEGKVDGLRVTAERSIGLAKRSLRVSGLITAGIFGTLLVILLLMSAQALLLLSVAK